MQLDAKQVFFSYGGAPVLQGVDLSAGSGEIIALLGPNGTGKSTLFRCLLGFLHPQQGQILVEGKPIETFSRRELAGKIAYIPQSHSPAFDHTVLDSVLMGAGARLGLFRQPGNAEKARAMDALEELGMAHLAHRGVMKISGGERQLMLLARALVQDAGLLIMDEPTANLDYGNSFRVMQKVGSLRAKAHSVLLSTHDPNQAFRFADRVITLKNGRILSDGTPEETVTPELLYELYGTPAAVEEIRVGTGFCKVCVPCGEERIGEG